jgi:4-amino-4-deoxy-L-arabinose transferase-like glycosyltransferase
MDRQEQAGRQGAQLGEFVFSAQSAADAADAAFWRRAAVASVLALTALRLLFLALSPLELDFEEAQYWFWAQALDWGYYSKPPLIAWLIAASTALFGDGEFGVRAWSPVLHGAAALCLGAVGGRLAGPRAGFCCALAYATLPGVVFSSLLMTTDVPLAFAWSLALYALLRVADRDGLVWAAVGGIAGGFGLLAKYSMLLPPRQILDAVPFAGSAVRAAAIA